MRIHSATHSFVAASIKSTPDRGSPWNFQKIWSEETDGGGNRNAGREGRNQEVNTSDESPG